ncbi:MAG: IclR family transcriptional regulator [Burkholderiales bacterium]|nr:IclR family transcriptional regulator [Burkholderiales bacterium]
MQERRKLEPDAKFATTLANGLQILSMMRADGIGVTNAEIAAELQLKRSSVSRLCSTLLELGYLSKGADGRYRAAPHVLTLAHPMLASLRLRQRALPDMRDFAELAQANVSLTVMDGLYSINIETIRTFDTAPHIPEVGMLVPLELSSMGRALISMQTDAERERILEEIARARPENWARFGQEARDEIQKCKERGFAIALGGFDPTVYAAGAPVCRINENMDVAVGCAVPAYRLRPGELEEHWGPRLAALAERLESYMRPPASAGNARAGTKRQSR